MTSERRITREDAEAMMAQIKSALASGEGEATVQLADSELLVEKTADGGFTIRAPGEFMRARLFMAPQALPDAYPPGLPFIPGESVTLTDVETSASLIWWAPRDAQQLLLELHQQCLGSGWALSDETKLPDLPVTHRSYAKTGFERVVFGSGGMVTLIQKKMALQGPASK